MTLLKEIEGFIDKVHCGFCQITGLPLNEVPTGKKAVVNMPEKNGEAIGLVCDQCLREKRQPQLVIQHDGKRLINEINIQNLEDYQQTIEVKPEDEVIHLQDMAPDVDVLPKFKDKIKKKQAD